MRQSLGAGVAALVDVAFILIRAAMKTARGNPYRWDKCGHIGMNVGYTMPATSLQQIGRCVFGGITSATFKYTGIPLLISVVGWSIISGTVCSAYDHILTNAQHCPVGITPMGMITLADGNRGVCTINNRQGECSQFEDFFLEPFFIGASGFFFAMLTSAVVQPYIVNFASWIPLPQISREMCYSLGEALDCTQDIRLYVSMIVIAIGVDAAFAPIVIEWNKKVGCGPTCDIVCTPEAGGVFTSQQDVDSLNAQCTGLLGDFSIVTI